MNIQTFKEKLEESLFSNKPNIPSNIRSRIIRNCFILGDEDKTEIRKRCFEFTEKYINLLCEHPQCDPELKASFQAIKFNSEVITQQKRVDVLNLQKTFIDLKNEAHSKNDEVIFGIVATINKLFKYETDVWQQIKSIVKHIDYILSEMNMWFAIDSGIQHSDSMDALVSTILNLEFFGSLKKRIDLLTEIDTLNDSRLFYHSMDQLHLIAQYILNVKLVERILPAFNSIMDDLKTAEEYVTDLSTDRKESSRLILARLERKLDISRFSSIGTINDLQIELLANKTEVLIDNSKLSDSLDVIKEMISCEGEIAKRVFILDRRFHINSLHPGNSIESNPIIDD